MATTKLYHGAAYAAIGIVWAFASISVHAAPTDKPNIVYIMSDDHRWDALGIAGHPNLKTPNLDRMAKEGQWYREATIQVSTCSASRAAILTGLPPARNGWYSNQQQRTDVNGPDGFAQYNLLPKELVKAGYHTAFVGKWHISPNPWNCGFETVKRWMEAGAGPYKNPRLSNGKVRDSKVIQGFTQTLFADDAIEVLKEAAKPDTTQPLFMWLAFTAPHAPFKPNPAPVSGMYDSKSSKELAPPYFYEDPDKTDNAPGRWRVYSEAITALDAEVGRVMDTIRNSSLSTNTVVVFIGDNGFMLGRRGLYGKYVPYDDSTRVPLIMWGPESIIGARGTTVTAQANSLDLPPTFVKLAGAVPPADWVGRDLTPVLKDGKAHDITWAVSSYPDHSKKLSHVDAYRVIRTHEHKLIDWHPAANLKPELYDLIADPREEKNLYGTPAIAEVQAKLEKQLADYRAGAKDTEWDMKGPVIDFRAGRRKGEAEDNEEGNSAARRPARKKAATQNPETNPQ